MDRNYFNFVICFIAVNILITGALHAQTVSVKSFQKISALEGGFTGALVPNALLGAGLDNLGDIDGDGVTDLILPVNDHDGGTNRGAVWIVFLNEDGTVKANQKISDTEGGFTGVLDDDDNFGAGIGAGALGDLDGDGVPDVTIGAPGDDDGGNGRGAVWVLFLNSDGTVKSHQKISDTEGNFTGDLDDNGSFAKPISIGDLDGDGVSDMAAGQWKRNRIWILFMNPDGTVKAHQEIKEMVGGFTGDLDPDDSFGPLVGLGDVDGDGISDIAVGAAGDDDGGDARGAVWVLFMNTDGTVKAHQKISATEGGLTDLDLDGQEFGFSVGSLGDVDGDGISELVVGALERFTTSDEASAVWILFLNPDGTVRASQKIDEGVGGFTGDLDSNDNFGSSVAGLGDLDGNGVPDLVVQASGDDDGGTNRGAVYILFLETQAVESFTLIDAETDQPIAGYDPIPQNAVLNFSVLPRTANIRANTTGAIESVRFSFENKENFRTENVAPYALYGDFEGDYAAGRLRVGTHTLVATPYSEDNASGMQGQAGQLDFTVVRQGPSFGVRQFVLVDEATDEDLIVLTDGMTFEISVFPQHPNVRADVIGPVESVRFTLEPQGHAQTENVAPYALFGDNAGDYHPGTFELGMQTLTATAYKGDNATGQASAPYSITLNVVVSDASSKNAHELDNINAQGNPASFMLEGAYPNPFNPTTTIRMAVPEAASVRLLVYDVLGRHVKTLVDGKVQAGVHDIPFDAGNLPSGTYLCRLETPAGVFTQQILLLK